MASEVPIKGDVIRIYKQGGSAKLRIEGTLDLTSTAKLIAFAGGGLQNIAVNDAGEVVVASFSGDSAIADYLDGAP